MNSIISNILASSIMITSGLYKVQIAFSTDTIYILLSSLSYDCSNTLFNLICAPCVLAIAKTLWFLSKYCTLVVVLPLPGGPTIVVVMSNNYYLS